jgi:hypothetical protein
MIVAQPGKYRLTKDFVTRGSYSVGTIPAGTVIEITQVDRMGNQVIGPDLEDWTYWEMPVEAVV